MPRGGKRPGAGRKPSVPEPRKPGRPTTYDPAFCDAVERDMAKGYSLTAFAASIGVSRSTINEWMGQNPEFSEAVSRAKAARLRNWETVALDMRTHGGGPGGATVTIFGLKNMGGEEWSDKQTLEHTGPNGGPVQANLKVEFLTPLADADPAS